MGKLVLITDAEVDVGSGSADRLARLGVTQLTILRDGAGTAVMLEGWAFDPATSQGEARDLLGLPNGTRSFHQIAHLSVASPVSGPTA